MGARETNAGCMGAMAQSARLERARFSERLTAMRHAMDRPCADCMGFSGGRA
jgi:hypothetical protein